jgi:hypothetical protein
MKTKSKVGKLTPSHKALTKAFAKGVKEAVQATREAGYPIYAMANGKVVVVPPTPEPLRAFAANRAHPEQLRKQAGAVLGLIRTINFLIGYLGTTESGKKALDASGLKSELRYFVEIMGIGHDNTAAECSDWLNYSPEGKKWPDK